MSLLPKPKPVSVVGHIVPDVEENERKSADLTIACLSRLEAYKGIEVLLRAFARVRRGKLILAGDGSLRGPLEALAGELDLNGSVEFRGALAPDDAAAVLRSATVLAIPSVAEGTPLALLEGMAAGKPIVATRVGGIPDTIRDEESGLLVDPGNVEQLAEALDRAISGEELRRSLGAGARAAFEQCQHTERAGVNAALALYNQASGGFADSRRSTVITPEWRSGSAGLSEVWEYRDLLYLMVVRDLKLRYQQATVGVAWVVLQPLLIMLVLTGFAALTGVKTGAVPYPLFAVSGLVPWTYFVHAFTTATYSLVSHSDLLGKIYFPRLIVPLSTTLAGAVDFLVAASLLPFFMLYYGAAPTPALLALPLCVVFALAAALALGLWLAVLNLRYSDVGNAIPFFTQLLFFTTPIAYPANLAPEPWRTVLGLNPMVGVVEAFRWSLLGTARAPMHQSALVSLAVVVILLAGAIRYFRGRESEFADRL
jgi:lipopolysaccharide transport system permease protein